MPFDFVPTRFGSGHAARILQGWSPLISRRYAGNSRTWLGLLTSLLSI